MEAGVFPGPDRNRDVAFVHEQSRNRMSATLSLLFLLFSLAGLGLGLPRDAAADSVEAGAPVPVAPEPTPEPLPQIRLRGEVVETACFIMAGRRGAEHRQCAIASARAGQQLGVLDEKTNVLYVAVVDRQAGETESPLLPFIAHRVEVRGQPLEHGELPAIIVSDVRSLRSPR